MGWQRRASLVSVRLGLFCLTLDTAILSEQISSVLFSVPAILSGRKS